VLACPRCGQENPLGFRFCGACAAPLSPEATARREERKVVTVLFADLVGFTARAERLDPEDVRALLVPYFVHLRGELERYGGTVEKFIGDAVMALFGAPIAHEDDPERAVRAALAIRDWIVEEEPELQVRIAVNTGEALVALGARPNEGELTAAGDVVNTAARMQAAAPVNGILVGDQAYRATAHAIEFRATAPIEAKGKSGQIVVWEAVAARARFGVDVVQMGAPLVGRSRELDLLADMLARVRAERSPQLATIVGVPGIGKSRLVYELWQLVDADPDLISWRQGRSLPYGDGVTYWALAEMVKAQAGVLETDSGELVEEKLREAVIGLDDEEWLAAHLRPLLGIEVDGDAGSTRRADSFAAWRRFFEGLAEQGPLVLVFEDLHWADDDLLDFVDHLIDRTSGVPILVVCTARPELLERRQGWGGGKPNAATVSLSPLSDDDTAQLVAALVEPGALSEVTRTSLIARAGGNPLYAEQFAHMIQEARAGELAVPETVQGIIAARLDSLPPEEKALLQDASVVGKVFWVGAIATIGSEARDLIEERLHALGRKEFVRHERRSTVAGEAQYTFRHVLIRDVAYGQIPRSARAAKHTRAAEWIGSLPRVEDHAEMLAHHYTEALALARASGRPTADLEAHARRALRDAGDRAFGLNALAPAARFYEAALEHWPKDDPGYPSLAVALGRSRADDPTLSDALLEEAHEGFLQQGDRAGAALAQALLAGNSWARGGRERVRRHSELALELIGDEPSSQAKSFVLSVVARYAMLAGEYGEAVSVGAEAMQMAKEHGRRELEARNLNTIGMARAAAGDIGGIEDIERSIELAVRANSLHEHYVGLVNLSSSVAQYGDLRRAESVMEQASGVAVSSGIDANVRWDRMEQAGHAYFRGDWDETEHIVGEARAELETRSEHYLESLLCDFGSRIRRARGDLDGALALTGRQLELVRRIGDPQVRDPGLANRAHALLAAGQPEAAAALVDELLDAWRVRLEVAGIVAPLDAAWVLRAVGREEELLGLLDAAIASSLWFEAAADVLRGDLVAAADCLHRIGSLPDEAFARQRAAEQLFADGRGEEGGEQLRRALEFWRSVGATAYLREGEALLGAATSA
jgi:class 3 adenylate cyclase